MDRVAQLTTNAWDLYPPIRAFDLLVPKDATVAVFLPGDTYEYPLFGKHLTRTLVPINSFVGGFQAIPANADYLLYAKGFPLASANDLHLGADWFLRRLPGARDEAVEYFKAALKLSPDNAPHHNMLGIEYAARGLLYEAIEEFRVAVSLEPAERSYRSNLEKATTLKKADGNANPDINVRKRK